MNGRRGGLVSKVHRLFAPLNSRLESNKEEEGGRGRPPFGNVPDVFGGERDEGVERDAW